MFVRMDVSLDPTLGCGQAHRWRKQDGAWTGVLGHEVVRLVQEDGGFEAQGCSSESRLKRYFRSEDDLDAIIREISARDPYVASLSQHCPGLRILEQDRWECLATYLLATNANVARIGKMVESVCDLFGDDLGERRSFPSPKQILDRCDEISTCRLGFREGRFVELARRVEDGEIDPDGLAELDYFHCAEALQGIKGVGPKVADCVALFAYGHLESFPVDVRISKEMERMYGVTGSYSKVSSYGREKFGAYAGYAQELLYHSPFIDKG